MARYIAEGCDIKGKVRNLVTVGTPNMGYVDPPKCQFAANWLLSWIVNSDHEDDLIHLTAQKYLCSAGTWLLETVVVHFSWTYSIF
jgi:hypothetical protein